MRQLQNPEDFVLTDEDKITLLKISRQTLTEYILTGRIPQFDESEFSENLQIPAGAFVTLKKGEQLRGCIGRFEPSDPLWKVVVLMTIAAATEDPRFTPVRPEELDEIFIEISVLTPLKRVYSLDEIEIGKHGIYCREGFMSGTLLPQVAVEQGWDVREFVSYCCKYKAGLDEECWTHAELYVYEAIVFDEKEYNLV